MAPLQLNWSLLTWGPGGSNEGLEWLPEYAQGGILRLSQLQNFSSLKQEVVANADGFKKMLQSREPQKEAFPGGLDGKYSEFQKLLILQALRPDKFAQKVKEFLAKELGPEAIQPRTLNLASAYERSSATTPILV